MKINIIELISIISILSFMSCSPEKSEMHIDLEMTDSHKHIGHGYYVAVPEIYDQAKSYDGFQVKGYESSIAIENRYDSFEELIRIYHKDNFRSPDLDLIEVRPIIGPDNFKGLLVIIKNNAQKRMDIRFFFEDHDRTFEIKSYYLSQFSDKYKSTVREAILSIARGEEEKKEEELQLASLISLSEVIYTRDGIYPTKALDGLTIEEVHLDDMKSKSIRELMKKSLKELRSEKEYIGSSGEKLGNGIKYFTTFENNGRIGTVMIITNDKNNEGLLVKCYGNYNLNYEMINDILQKRYFTISLDRK